MTDAFPLLVTADWLQENLGAVRVLDCTTHMTPQPVGPSKIESGQPDFDRTHIPGAQHVDMVEDLSDPAGEFPYTLPEAEQIEALLSRLGISASDHIVLYTTTHLMVATRAWYVLRALGHRKVSILDGGLEAWTAAGYPVETAADSSKVAGSPGVAGPDGAEQAPGRGATAGLGVIASGESALGSRVADARPSETAPYAASPDASRYASKSDVAAALADGSSVVVNALSAEQYAGAGGAHYGRPGRIPGSVNVPTATILTNDGKSFAPVEAIREQFAAQGVTSGSRVITYCGGGIAATVDAFALALIENDNWAVYDNSLLEWSTDPERPMATD